MKRNTKLLLKAYAQLSIGTLITITGAKLFFTYLGQSNVLTIEFWYGMGGAAMFALGIVYGIIRAPFTLQNIVEERIVLKVSKEGLFEMTERVVNKGPCPVTVKFSTETNGHKLVRLMPLLKEGDEIELVYNPKLLEGEKK